MYTTDQPSELMLNRKHVRYYTDYNTSIWNKVYCGGDKRFTSTLRIIDKYVDLFECQVNL